MASCKYQTEGVFFDFGVACKMKGTISSLYNSTLSLRTELRQLQRKVDLLETQSRFASSQFTRSSLAKTDSETSRLKQEVFQQRKVLAFDHMEELTNYSKYLAARINTIKQENQFLSQFHSQSEEPPSNPQHALIPQIQELKAQRKHLLAENARVQREVSQLHKRQVNLTKAVRQLTEHKPKASATRPLPELSSLEAELARVEALRSAELESCAKESQQLEAKIAEKQQAVENLRTDLTAKDRACRRSMIELRRTRVTKRNTSHSKLAA